MLKFKQNLSTQTRGKDEVYIVHTSFCP